MTGRAVRVRRPVHRRDLAPPPAPVATQRARIDGLRFVRGSEPFRVQGVTYGPFPPGPDGSPFPDPGRVRDDFAGMAEVGVNCIRTYHVPPEWLL